ncbi:unnamed protein product [Debaryomyces tyrocola]|nr:unnamed protein product [Debaryomyces tyrocola]
MSFANFDIEAQRSVSKGNNENIERHQSQSQNELDTIIDKASDQLQLFSNLISQFDAKKKLIGSKRDYIQLRDNAGALISKISDMDSAIQILIENLSHLINKKLGDKRHGTNDDQEDSSSKLEITQKQMVIKERLVSEFNELHKQFQRSARQYTEKTRTYPVKDDIPRQDERTPLIDSEQGKTGQQVAVQEPSQDQIDETELQYHLMLTQERNQNINQINEGILEINSIFKDLGELVNQQGEQLDTVEDNILQLSGNTQQAERELTKAHEYQKKKSKWSCILLFALCIFVLVIVLAVLS